MSFLLGNVKFLKRQYFCITSVLIWQGIPDLFLFDLTDLFCLK